MNRNIKNDINFTYINFIYMPPHQNFNQKWEGGAEGIKAY